MYLGYYPICVLLDQYLRTLKCMLLKMEDKLVLKYELLGFFVYLIVYFNILELILYLILHFNETKKENFSLRINAFLTNYLK